MAKDIVKSLGHATYDYVLQKIGANPKVLMVYRNGVKRKMQTVNYETAVEMVAYLTRSLKITEVYRKWYKEMVEDYVKTAFGQNLKEEVFKCIKRYDSNGGATFTDLEQNFARHGYDYKGDASLAMAGDFENPIYLWAGWTKEAFAVLDELTEEGQITQTPIDPLAYYYDGKSLNLPVIHPTQPLQSGGWLPVSFSTTGGLGS